MTPVLYGIPNCDTVKKARIWLTQNGIDYTFHDFKKLGVPQERIDSWIEQVGWEKLLNRQGNTWRKLTPDAQAGVTDAKSAKVVMIEHPSTIKRPVVEWGSHTTVGFKPHAWPPTNTR